MLDYNYRIRHRYGMEAVSLAVLTDSSPTFRPHEYAVARWGFEITFRFPTVKLLDYEGRRAELETSMNPFSLVVLAHLDSWKARTDAQRYAAKFGLFRTLFGRGFSKRDIIGLFRFVDWMIELPRELEDRLEQVILELE